MRPRKNKTDAETATKNSKENPKKIKVEKDEDVAAKTPDYKEGRRSLPAFHPFRNDKVRFAVKIKMLMTAVSLGHLPFAHKHKIKTKISVLTSKHFKILFG